MAPKTPTPRNDGWTDIAYDFGSNAADNARLSALLNEACHVFHHVCPEHASKRTARGD